MKTKITEELRLVEASKKAKKDTRNKKGTRILEMKTTNRETQRKASENITTRESTWNRLGKDVTLASNVMEALQIANLDYSVVKKPIYLDNGIAIPDKFATVRESDGRIYGIVSDKYSVVNNLEAFDFIDGISEDIKFLKAGETVTGIVWVIAELPGIDVMGDPFKPYLIFRNGFARNTQITVAICPLRVVCQNQFNYAFANANNVMRILHVGDVQSKMYEAQQVMAMQVDFMKRIKDEAERLTKVKITDGHFDSFVDRMFPVHEDMNPYALHRMEIQRNAIRDAYFHDDNSNFTGTAWGVFNAYSDFITHLEPTGKSENRFENQFIRTTFGPMDAGQVEGLLLAA